MNKKDYKRIIVSSLFCLIPIIFGLLVYNDLPDKIAIHWNSSGVADGFADKLSGILNIPITFAIINTIVQIAVCYDPKRKNLSDKVSNLFLYLLPAICLIMQPITLLIALGVDIDIQIIVSLLIGVVFVVMGNYLPKCKLNYTVGIRLPWTLADENNWNKTHRLSGFLFVVVGLLIVLNALMNLVNTSLLFIVAIVILLVVPTLYSFMLYKNTQKAS